MCLNLKGVNVNSMFTSVVTASFQECSYLYLKIHCSLLFLINSLIKTKQKKTKNKKTTHLVAHKCIIVFILMLSSEMCV